jgi:hypothetical protein
MNMKKAYLSLILAFLLFALPLTFNRVEAQGQTTMNVVPNKVLDISVGGTFTVNITAADVVDLFSWQGKIFFDPSVLNCTKAEYPTSGGLFTGHTTVPVSPIIDNAGGSVLHGCSLSGDDKVSGTGTLFLITFKVLAIGQSDINFSRPYGGDTFLWDFNLNEIPATLHDGFFANVPTPKRDVAVTALSLSTKFPKQNDTVTISVTVLNNGTEIETFDVSVSYDTTLIDTQTVNSLGAGNTANLNFEWNTTGVAPASYTIKAEASAVPNEDTLANNVKTTPVTVLSGAALETDLDGSGMVDIRDVAEAARAFGTSEGDLRWDPKADINQDGVINLKDLFTICHDFGKMSG